MSGEPGESKPNYDGKVQVVLTRGAGIYGDISVTWSVTPRDERAFLQVEGMVNMADLQQTATIILQVRELCLFQCLWVPDNNFSVIYGCSQHFLGRVNMELMVTIIQQVTKLLIVSCLWVNCPSQQYFSHVRIEPPLSGFYSVLIDLMCLACTIQFASIEALLHM